MSHLYAVSQGDLTGWSHAVKFGAIASVAVLPSTLWEPGGSYPFLVAAETLEVVSASASDSAAGAGARTVVISGLDAAWMPQIETVTLNGLTPVATAKQWWRVNLFMVMSAGSLLTNVGAISLRSSGGGTLRDLIGAGIGVARTCVFSTGARQEMMINLLAATAFDATVGQSANLLQHRVHNHEAGVVTRSVGFKLSGDGRPYHHMADPPIYIGPKRDYSWEVIARSGAAGGVGVYFSASLVDMDSHSSPDGAEHPRW